MKNQKLQENELDVKQYERKGQRARKATEEIFFLSKLAKRTYIAKLYCMKNTIF